VNAIIKSIIKDPVLDPAAWDDNREWVPDLPRSFRFLYYLLRTLILRGRAHD
jgi:hypothetical protein